MMRLWICALCLAVGLSAVSLAEQEGVTPTLHVYTNTIQIPVLVLGSDRQPTGLIGGSRFEVSLDSGPKFRATHVRLEGDDPISRGRRALWVGYTALSSRSITVTRLSGRQGSLCQLLIRLCWLIR